jgi:hypothetical protein
MRLAIFNEQGKCIDFFTKMYAPAMWNGGFPKEEPPLHSTMAWACTLGWYLMVPHVGGLRCFFTTSSATLILFGLVLQPAEPALMTSSLLV